jgi:hypothetical protein
MAGGSGRRIGFGGPENGVRRRLRESASLVAKGEPNEALRLIGKNETCRSNKGEGSDRLLEASWRLVQESVKRTPQSIDDISLAGGSGHAYVWVQRVTGARKCLLLCRRCLQNSGSPKYCYDNDQGRQSATGPVRRLLGIRCHCGTLHLEEPPNFACPSLLL